MAAVGRISGLVQLKLGSPAHAETGAGVPEELRLGGSRAAVDEDAAPEQFRSC
jgi:hypothetical protein